MKTIAIAVLIIVLAAGVYLRVKKADEVEPQAPVAAPAPPKVDNAATQYVGGLQADVQKAEAAALKATESIRQTQSSIPEN